MLAATASASDVSALVELGQSVYVTAKPQLKIESSPRRVVGNGEVLDRIAFDMARLDTSHYVVSGRVVSTNAGFGLNLVPIYIGTGSHAPRLAGVTNQDGEFKFRLLVIEPTASNWLYIPPSLDGFLYVGGLPSVNRDYLQLEAALEDGFSERYPIKGLMDWASRQKLKKPD